MGTFKNKNVKIVLDKSRKGYRVTVRFRQEERVEEFKGVSEIETLAKAKYYIENVHLEADEQVKYYRRLKTAAHRAWQEVLKAIEEETYERCECPHTSKTPIRDGIRKK